MKLFHFLAALLTAVLLVSCAPKVPPRAILPPEVTVTKIQTKPTEDASRATRDAVREVAKAGAETRRAADKLTTTSERLRAEIDRAENMAAANEEMRAAFVQIQTFSRMLSEDVSRLTLSVTIAEEKEKLALLTIDDQEKVIADLKGEAMAQEASIIQAARTAAVLREQAAAGNDSRDALIVANKNITDLKSLRWKLWAAVGGLSLAVLGLGYLSVKTIFF